jgi:hypothetical protein
MTLDLRYNLDDTQSLLDYIFHLESNVSYLKRQFSEYKEQFNDEKRYKHILEAVLEPIEGRAYKALVQNNKELADMIARPFWVAIRLGYQPRSFYGRCLYGTQFPADLTSEELAEVAKVVQIQKDLGVI